MKAIINVRLFDYENYLENAYVIFDKQIVEVGKMKDFVDMGYEIKDGKGKLLMPSFVCAHAHIYSIFARGLALPFDPHNFMEILTQMWWKLDAKISNDITYYSGIAASKEFLQNGVTTVIDHHASGIDILGSLTELKKSVVDVAHLRGIFCFETSDRYDVSECLKENVNFAKENSSHDVGGLFGLHASISLSDNTLSEIAKIQDDIPLHVHVAESKMDEDDSLEKYSIRIMNRLEKFNLLKEDSLIVHGVSLNDAELDVIKAHKCVLVVNTTSNMNNAVGLPNVKNYLDHDIPVMVGNDGLNSNMASEYMNVLYTSHLLNNSPKELNVGDVSKLINNAYEYVSRRLNIKLGRIKKGYEADMMMVDYNPFTKMDSSNAFGHIFYGLFPSFKPEDVISHGNYEVENYKLTNKLLLSEFDKCNKYADKLWSLVKEEN